MTEITERKPARNARKLVITPDPCPDQDDEGNIIERDEFRIEIIGPKGKRYGIMFADRGDLIKAAREIIARFGREGS